MYYAKFLEQCPDGHASDICVIRQYRRGDTMPSVAYLCIMCTLYSDQQVDCGFSDPVEMVKHIEEHLAVGHYVPKRTIPGLYEAAARAEDAARVRILGRLRGLNMCWVGTEL